MERPTRNSYLRILDSRGAPDRTAAFSGPRGINKISEASKTYSLEGSPQAYAASPRGVFIAVARTLDSGFWTNPVQTPYYKPPDRVPSPDATFSWSPDSGFWTRYGSVKSATLDPGLRTPDSGPGRPAVPLSPDSGTPELRTLLCP